MEALCMKLRGSEYLHKKGWRSPGEDQTRCRGSSATDSPNELSRAAKTLAVSKRLFLPGAVVRTLPDSTALARGVATLRASFRANVDRIAWGASNSCPGG